MPWFPRRTDTPSGKPAQSLMRTSHTVDVGALLDAGSWSTYQKLMTVLVALAIIFDGFDIQILGFALPSLIRDWHVARGDFGPVDEAYCAERPG